MIRNCQIHMIIHVISVSLLARETRISSVMGITSHLESGATILPAFFCFIASRYRHIVHYPMMMIVQADGFSESTKEPVGFTTIDFRVIFCADSFTGHIFHKLDRVIRRLNPLAKHYLA